MTIEQAVAFYLAKDEPRNCAVVTWANGRETRFINCDADEYTRDVLTITDRITRREYVFLPGTWQCAVVYDPRGHYRYVIDKHPAPIVVVELSTQQPPAA